VRIGGSGGIPRVVAQDQHHPACQDAREQEGGQLVAMSGSYESMRIARTAKKLVSAGSLVCSSRMPLMRLQPQTTMKKKRPWPDER
jgi:hypothetical protein